MEEPNELLGLDLLPLPHESIFSLLARLSWMNALTWAELRRLLHQEKSGAIFFGHEETSLRRRLADAGGWSTSAAMPFLYGPYDERIASAWFDRELVVCPQCMEGLYHSHWHQLRQLQHCPIHGCALLRQCTQCSRPFGSYRFNGELLAKPFCCKACGAPYSTSMPSWSGMSAFRKQHPNLRRQWEPWHRWSQRLSVRLQPFAPHAKSLDDGRLATWWGLTELVYALTNQFHESPPQCDWPKQDITWLVWPIHMEPRFVPFNPYPTRSQWAQSNTPYEDTLSELRAWILSTSTLPTQSHNPEFLDEKGGLRNEGWSPAALAYMLLRRGWEYTDAWSPVAPLDTLRLKVSRWRSFHLPRQWGVEYTSLTLRALVLAVFAALFWKIQRSDGWNIGACSIDDAAAAALYSDATKPTFCLLCFPTIAGMPLNGFCPPDLRLEDARELLALSNVRRRRAHTHWRLYRRRQAEKAGRDWER